MRSVWGIEVVVVVFGDVEIAAREAQNNFADVKILA
jgi:hypothetical protein